MGKEKSTGAMTGPEKAAIFLISLGDDLAAEVMKHLDEKEIHQIGNYMSYTADINSERINRIAQEFVKMNAKGEFAVAGGKEYLRKLLEKTLDPKRANEILNKIAFPGEDIGGGLDALRMLDSKTIANFLRNEHPQTCAIVLAHLDAAHAAEVIKELPERFRPEITFRLATLERIPPGVIKELDEALAQEFRSTGAMESSQIGGVAPVAEIMNHLDHGTEGAILAEIEAINPELADSIRQLMFVFEDLVKLDDRSMQTVLKEISSEDLLLGVKTASDDLKEKIFKNMSERAATMLKEDIEAMGPVKVSEVEKAQQNILRIVKKLEGEGKIVIAGAGEELV